MKNLKFKIKNVKLFFVILIIVALIVLFLFYRFVLSDRLYRNQFANQMIEISDENENAIFNIQRVLLYSSADAIDHSDNQSLSNMSINQFTDLSIFIDNSKTITDLTNENTVKELYIDNIVIKSDDKGSKLLNYKNALSFGEYKELELPTNNRIDFKIINTNNENENNNYDEPTFYTDCSNPITLGYINRNIVDNYSISEKDTSVSFNGKVLEQAHINIEDINYTLNFTIHIINNLNQKFAYNMKLDINLADDNSSIYNGYIYKGKTTTGDEYRFFRELD